MRAVDTGGEADAVSGVDAQIVEMRAKISQALTSYHAECIAIQGEIERWNSKYRTVIDGKYRVVRRMLRACAFAEKCQSLADRLGCRTFVCQDVEAVLAAQILRSDETIIVLDLAEPPSYRMRSEDLDRLPDPLAYALDRAISGLVSLADVLIVTSATSAAELQKTGLQTVLISEVVNTKTTASEFEQSRNGAALITHLRGARTVAMLRAERPANEQRSCQIASMLLDHGIDLTIVTAHLKIENDNTDELRAQVSGARYIEIPVDV